MFPAPKMVTLVMDAPVLTCRVRAFASLWPEKAAHRRGPRRTQLLSPHLSALNARLSFMGKNQQQRRAAKRRERVRRRPTDPGTHRGSGQESNTGHGEGHRFVSDTYGGGGWTRSEIGNEELLRHQANQTLKEQIALARRIERTAFLAQLVDRWLNSQSELQQRILDEQMSLRFMAMLASLWEGAGSRPIFSMRLAA